MQGNRGGGFVSGRENHRANELTLAIDYSKCGLSRRAVTMSTTTDIRSQARSDLLFFWRGRFD
jgi:hypothetical protein